MWPTICFCLIIMLSGDVSGAVKFDHRTFGFPFDQSYFDQFFIKPPATISNEALQITPDVFNLTCHSGRIMFNHLYTFWTGLGRVASFSTSFVVNIYKINKPDGSSFSSGEGLAFIIAPQLYSTSSSPGEYLGLTDNYGDGDIYNQILAVELDTAKSGSFDPDSNHIGLDINSIKSTRTVSMSRFNITLAPAGIVFHKVWINYNGALKSISVYITTLRDRYDEARLPDAPVLKVDDVDLQEIVSAEGYFGFSASTGPATQELHSILSWNLTVELIGNSTGGGHLEIYLGVVFAVVAVLAICGGIGGYFWHKRGKKSDPEFLSALKNLPGVPREFEYKDLKKATSNFDEKNKLGQGSYGVVYKGIVPNENFEIAVKKFSRDEIKGKDDFLAELTIINRLRHRNLVKLLGWCHKNEMLLLVYEYMPKGA